MPSAFAIPGGIDDNAVTNAKLRDSAALSVIGRSASTAGDPADIAAAADGQVLRRAGSAVAFGAVDLADADAVTGLLPAANLANFSALTLQTDPDLIDLLPITDVSVPANKSVKVEKLAGLLLAGICGMRLSTELTVPLSTTDQVGKGHVYLNYYKGNQIVISDGTTDTLYTLYTELDCALNDATKSPAAVIADKNYDLFVWDDAGTLRLSRGPAWDSDTVRGDAAGKAELGFFKGRQINKWAITNGPAATRGTYVGTIRGTGFGTTEDSEKRRFVWNFYNREPRVLYKACEAGASGPYHTTSSNVMTPWGNGVAPAGTYGPLNRFHVVTGIAGVVVDVTVGGEITGGPSSGRGLIGLGLNTTSAANLIAYWPLTQVTYANNSSRITFALGYSYIQALEQSMDSQTINLYSTVITGDLLA